MFYIGKKHKFLFGIVEEEVVGLKANLLGHFRKGGKKSPRLYFIEKLVFSVKLPLQNAIISFQHRAKKNNKISVLLSQTLYRSKVYVLHVFW